MTTKSIQRAASAAGYLCVWRRHSVWNINQWMRTHIKKMKNKLKNEWRLPTQSAPLSSTNMHSKNRTTNSMYAFRNRSLCAISNASTFISSDQILFTIHRCTNVPTKIWTYNWILGSNSISIYISISWKATDQFLIGFCAIILRMFGIHFL